MRENESIFCPLSVQNMQKIQAYVIFCKFKKILSTYSIHSYHPIGSNQE